MPIQNFDGDTFVAFTDISGFKEMMKIEGKAVSAINDFYNAGFNALQKESSINGFFVSDCGILFSKNGDEKKLECLLRVVKELNCTMLKHGIMLTTSIAWGPFYYHNRIEFPGINKQPIYGNAYISAFLDNESGKPKIQPGQCRIIKKLALPMLQGIEQFELMEETKTHYLFYWNVNSSTDIEPFKQRYSDSYNLKYSGMLSALGYPIG
jgi:hypothetical protein